MEDVHLWMIDQHLGRRSISDFQRGVLALRKRRDRGRRSRSARLAAAPATEEATAAVPETASADHAAPPPEPLDSREALARAARLSSSQVVMIEKIQKQATPELVEAIKAGTISLSAGAAVASLPAQEQVAAAAAGKDELKQAAKRVRESKRKPRERSATLTRRRPWSRPIPRRTPWNRCASVWRTLTSENTALRKQVANLLNQLLARPGAETPEAEDASAPF